MKKTEKNDVTAIANLAKQLDDKEKLALERFARDLIFIKKVSEAGE